MNVLSTETIYTRQSGAEGGSGKEVMRGIWKGVSEGEGRGGEQGAFQEGLIGGGDTQPWTRGGGGHCRELRAGGGGWNIKWDTKEAREVAGGRGAPELVLCVCFSLFVVLLPAPLLSVSVIILQVFLSLRISPLYGPFPSALIFSRFPALWLWTTYLYSKSLFSLSIKWG